MTIPPLIHRQELWTLTLQGWVVTLVCAIALMVFSIAQLHPFLAVNSPIQADILVVEGWLPDYALKSAISEFKSGSYRKLITTGVPLTEGYYLSKYKTLAELGAATLIALGFDKEQLIAVPAPDVMTDRTYACAVAVRGWLSTSNLEVRALNIYTYGPHARRSRLLYKKVFSPNIKVGAIAVEPQDYDRNNWWKSSIGVRTVISELIAYIYARFFDWS